MPNALDIASLRTLLAPLFPGLMGLEVVEESGEVRFGADCRRWGAEAHVGRDGVRLLRGQRSGKSQGGGGHAQAPDTAEEWRHGSLGIEWSGRGCREL